MRQKVVINIATGIYGK